MGLNPAHVLEIYHRAQQMVEHPPRTDEVEKVEKPKATGRKGKNRTLSIGLYTALALMFFIAIWISVGKNVEKAPGLLIMIRSITRLFNNRKKMINFLQEIRGRKRRRRRKVKDRDYAENTSAYDSYWNFKGAEDPEIKIVFIGKCWIDLHVDNKNIHQKNFYAGEELLLSVKNKMKLRLGNPPCRKGVY